MSKEKGFHYYTWYPKDWQTSDSVFNLSLEERAIYREFIDLAYLENNEIEPSENIWSRKWNVLPDRLDELIQSLLNIGLIKKTTKCYSVPSCDARLKLKNDGRNGGKTKGKAKGLIKGSAKGMAKQTEQTEQTEEENAPTINDFISFFTDEGYTEDSAKEAWQYYHDNNWINKVGDNVIKSWKFHARKQWFKEDKKKQEGRTFKTIGEFIMAQGEGDNNA